jgi:WD40 repeat protein
MVFSKDKSQITYLVSDYQFQKIVKMDVTTGAILKKVELKQPNDLSIFSATPDGFKFLADTPKGIAVIHNGTGKVLRTLPYPSKTRDFNFTPVQSRYGVLLAIPDQSKKIYLIHTGTGKIIRTINTLDAEVTPSKAVVRAIGFNHNRRLLAYSIQNANISTLHLYDINKEKEIFNIGIPSAFRSSAKISFSTNDKYLILTSPFHGFKLVNLHSKKLTSFNQDHLDFVGFSPDDKHLILVNSINNKILLQNIETAKIRKIATSITGYGGSEGSIIQSVDRSRLLLSFRALSIDKVNRFLLLDTSTGKLVKSLGKQ